MSLFLPTPGAVVDRMSILTLKIEAYCKAHRDTRQLLDEMLELRGYLDREPSPTHEAKLEELRLALAEVNKELWQCEDAIRSLPATAVLDIAKVGKRIPNLNDRRIRLIREIDRAWGCQEVTEEKIFNNVGA